MAWTSLFASLAPNKMDDGVLQAQCLKKVVVEERGADGSVTRSELSTELALKKEMGNARLVSDDAMLWVAHGSIQSKPVAAAENDAQPPKQHVTVTNGKRSFSFFLESNADSDSFLVELRAQVAGKSGLEAKRKKRKIRKQIVESQSAGFVPVVNSLASPMKPAPLTPNRRRLSDATNSPARLAPPLPMSVSSTVSDPHGVFTSPSKSPFRSPFRKNPTPPPPRVATPIVSLSLPPKSPAVSLTSSTPSPMAPRSASSSASSMTPPRPREWLSPARSGSGVRRVRPQLTPPSLRRESMGTPGSARSRDSSEKENTPVRSSGGGIVNKRVRSLQRMLDEVPREDLEHSAGARPPPVRSPYFLSPSNAREMSPVRRPSPAKKLRSPARPLGELQQNGTPPLRPLSALATTPGSTPESGGEMGLRKVTHGLLNLGNFCYMNAIVQSLAALPGFADRLQNDDWLLPIIKKHLAVNGADRSTREIAKLLETWTRANPGDRLTVQDKLAVLLQQVIDGSDSAINPEPLKNVMGRRNQRFASHFQQDAHEFLLQLVTEYEKELVEAVEGVLKMVTESEGIGEQPSEEPTPLPEPAPAEPSPVPPKKFNLLNFFRPAKKPEEAVPTETAIPEAAPAEASSQAKPSDQDALVAELFPAECFRAELYRTLTCCSCQYSRRQVEKFYDFSLDLPYVPMPKSPVREPQSEPALSGSLSQQCHCGVDAVVVESAGSRFYCCAKSSCSLRDKVEEETPTKPDAKLNDSTVSATTSTASASPQVPAMPSIQLADLLRDQFKSEVLELTCEKCKDGREATVRYEVKSLPRVLVLHLKRFEVNPETGFLYKRSDLVEAPRDLFPAQNIHGCDAEASDFGDKRYTLRSVVHHLGRTVDEGHYVADVCGPRGSWRRRNDTHETLIGEDFALRASRSQESCYMMFYMLAAPADAQELDKENVSAETPRSSLVASTPPRHPDSPASLVGRRREMTPPRRASTVSKSLHELL